MIHEDVDTGKELEGLLAKGGRVLQTRVVDGDQLYTVETPDGPAEHDGDLGYGLEPEKKAAKPAKKAKDVATEE